MFIEKLCYCIGGIIFAHAGYSSYEAQHLLGHSSTPIDIVLETLLALGLVVMAALMSIKNKPVYKVQGRSHDDLDPDSPLRDIIVNEPMEYPDTYLLPINMTESTAIFEDAGPSPYSQYESRLDMINLAMKRAEYKDWVRGKSNQRPVL